MRPRLDAFGRSYLSDAVRPAVFTPDESKLYFQVSFFAGVVNNADEVVLQGFATVGNPLDLAPAIWRRLRKRLLLG